MITPTTEGSRGTSTPTTVASTSAITNKSHSNPPGPQGQYQYDVHNMLIDIMYIRSSVTTIHVIHNLIIQMDTH